MAVDKATDEADAGMAGTQRAAHDTRTREHLIAETLVWCAEQFASNRVRFVRPTSSGGWSVHTLRNGSVTTHEADYAEAAMAYTVSLGRHPLLVGWPRVGRVGTNELRPITVHSYLGIPLICQDRLAGVIESAGEARPELEMALLSALPRLEQIGERLLYDPSLVRRAAVDADSVCVLSSASWSNGAVTLTGAQLAFLAAIDGATTVAAAAAAAGIEIEAALAMTRSLIEQGLITTSTNPAT